MRQGLAARSMGLTITAMLFLLAACGSGRSTPAKASADKPAVGPGLSSPEPDKVPGTGGNQTTGSTNTGGDASAEASGGWTPLTMGVSPTAVYAVSDDGGGKFSLLSTEKGTFAEYNHWRLASFDVTGATSDANGLYPVQGGTWKEPPLPKKPVSEKLFKLGDLYVDWGGEACISAPCSTLGSILSLANKTSQPINTIGAPSNPGPMTALSVGGRMAVTGALTIPPNGTKWDATLDASSFTTVYIFDAATNSWNSIAGDRSLNGKISTNPAAVVTATGDYIVFVFGGSDGLTSPAVVAGVNVKTGAWQAAPANSDLRGSTFLTAVSERSVDIFAGNARLRTAYDLTAVSYLPLTNNYAKSLHFTFDHNFSFIAHNAGLVGSQAILIGCVAEDPYSATFLVDFESEKAYAFKAPHDAVKSMPDFSGPALSDGKYLYLPGGNRPLRLDPSQMTTTAAVVSRAN